jgi:diguanylate cyclase (GGDEF)-like protein
MSWYGVMVETADWRSFLETTLVGVLDNSDEGILVFDTEGSCRMMGSKVGEFFSVDPQLWVGKPRPQLLVALGAACDDPESFVSAVARDDPSDPPRLVGDVEIRSPRRLLTWSMHPLRSQDQVVGRLVLVRDVTRERNAERTKRHLLERIEQLTHIDALTGLANRRRFVEEHEREHGRAMRAWDTYGVLRVDVDCMHEINNGFGTPVGDFVIERVGEMARLGRREYDVVARWENDEFAILLPGADGVAVRAVAQRIAAMASSSDGQRADVPHITISIGGAVCVPPTGESAEDVMHRCGDALHAARTRGTSQVEVDAPPATNGSQPPPSSDPSDEP